MNKGRKGGFKGETNCFRIIKMIMERNFAPVIVFSFSKKDCEAYALQMAKLEFNTKVSWETDVVKADCDTRLSMYLNNNMYICTCRAVLFLMYLSDSLNVLC